MIKRAAKEKKSKTYPGKLCQLCRRFLNASRMPKLQDQVWKWALMTSIKYFWLIQGLWHKGRKSRKKRQVALVSKINSSVTPTAKNRSLFFRNSLSLFYFFFFGNGCNACIEKLCSYGEDWATYWHMHQTTGKGMLLRNPWVECLHIPLMLYVVSQLNTIFQLGLCNSRARMVAL